VLIYNITTKAVFACEDRLSAYPKLNSKAITEFWDMHSVHSQDKFQGHYGVLGLFVRR
jgi:hypothetical protein